MAQSDTDQLRKTPLNALHRAAGARMASSVGWDLPAEYSGAVAEHMAVRTRAGLFDLSHFGQVEVAGRNALAAIQGLTTGDASRLGVGQALASAITTPDGTIVDCVRTYRLAGQHFLLIVSADAVARVAEWIQKHGSEFGDVIAIDTSSRYALIAIHGPHARDVLQQVTEIDLGAMDADCFASGEVPHARVTIGRTAGLGEEGYQILVPPQQAAAAWKAILDAGDEGDVIPVGTLARDTLRLEAGERFNGQDISAGTTLLEAGLDALVDWDKGTFVGREALERQRQSGVERRLVGFEMEADGQCAAGCQASFEGSPLGVVTSAARTPFLGKSVGLVCLPARHASPGSFFDVSVDGRPCRARVVALPFYNRDKR